MKTLVNGARSDCTDRARALSRSPAGACSLDTAMNFKRPPPPVKRPTGRANNLVFRTREDAYIYLLLRSGGRGPRDPTSCLLSPPLCDDLDHKRSTTSFTYTPWTWPESKSLLSPSIHFDCSYPLDDRLQYKLSRGMYMGSLEGVA